MLLALRTEPAAGREDTRRENRLGIIANRVRRHTLSSQSLLRFLDTLGVPIVATLRDSQNYVRAAEQGLGLEEMNPHQTGEDLAQWQSLYEWLDRRQSLPRRHAGLSLRSAQIQIIQDTARGLASLE